jgi:hypothetical protein
MKPIMGSEEIAAGRLTRAALRWNYTAIHPNVYVPRGTPLTASTRTDAARLWMGHRGVLAGRAAAFVSGVSWALNSEPVEFIGKHRRPVPGVVIRDERIADDEIRQPSEFRLTTAARTALDIARHLPREEALPIVDALAAGSEVTVAAVELLVARYPGVRGISAAREIVGLMDGGARSRAESLLRLRLIDTGVPRPRTDIVVEDTHWSTRIAMGWERAKVGVSYEPDGRLEGYSAVQQLAAEELVQRQGWIHIRAHPYLSVRLVVHRVRAALRQRGHPC